MEPVIVPGYVRWWRPLTNPGSSPAVGQAAPHDSAAFNQQIPVVAVIADDGGAGRCVGGDGIARFTTNGVAPDRV
ncbi:hypothetical protein IU399_18875 [Salmonella enterica subsp. enterica serovar Worthington]|nr:hypothetical protein [Salmonella enterica subsp. enterica serovar Worthington]